MRLVQTVSSQDVVGNDDSVLPVEKQLSPMAAEGIAVVECIDIKALVVGVTFCDRGGRTHNSPLVGVHFVGHNRAAICQNGVVAWHVIHISSDF